MGGTATSLCTSYDFRNLKVNHSIQRYRYSLQIRRYSNSMIISLHDYIINQYMWELLSFFVVCFFVCFPLFSEFFFVWLGFSMEHKSFPQFLRSESKSFKVAVFVGRVLGDLKEPSCHTWVLQTAQLNFPQVLWTTPSDILVTMHWMIHRWHIPVVIDQG